MIVPALRVRITNVDSTFVKTVDRNLDDTSLPSVPVIRIFGQAIGTSANACVHIHQAFPYIYIEYTGTKKPADVKAYISKLRTTLNYALGIHHKRPDKDRQNWRFIRHILFVKGMPFYGFHGTCHTYLKILLASPAMVQSAATILRSGAILGTPFVIYEAHLGYILQFLVDFNLYGCSILEIRDALVRGDIEDDMTEIDVSKFAASPLAKTTNMKYEFDIQTYQILNRSVMTARPHPSRLRVPPLLNEPLPSHSGSQVEPLVLSVRELWDSERVRRASLGLDPSPVLPVDPTNSQRGLGGDGVWQSSARNLADLKTRIEEEGPYQPDHKQEKWELLAWSAFESTEMLWAEEWRTLRTPVVQAQTTQIPERSLENTSSTRPNKVAGDPLNPFESSPEFPEDVQLTPKNKTKNKPAEPAVDLDILSSQEFRSAVYQESNYHEHGKVQPRSPYKPHLPSPPGTPLLTSAQIVSSPGDVTPRGRGANPFRTFSASPEKQRHLIPFITSGHGIAVSPQTDQDDPFTVKRKNSNLAAHQLSHHTKEFITGYTLPSPLFPDLSTETTPTSKDHITTEVDKMAPSSSGEAVNTSESSSSFPRAEPSNGERAAKRRRTTRIVSTSDFSSIFSSPVTPIQVSSSPLPNTFLYAPPPPSASSLLATLEAYNQPMQIYRDPYYSNPSDRNRPIEVAGFSLTIPGTGISALLEWDDDETDGSVRPLNYFSATSRYIDPALSAALRLSSNAANGVPIWQYASEPPGRVELQKWLLMNPVIINKGVATSNIRFSARSQIAGPTQSTPFIKSKVRNPSTGRVAPSMSVLAVEVFALCVKDREANPAEDAITAVFYSFQRRVGAEVDSESRRSTYEMGIIAIEGEILSASRPYPNLKIEFVNDELSLFHALQTIVLNLDPDVLTSFELQNSGWGYLVERAKSHFEGLSLGDMVSRVIFDSHTGRHGASGDWNLEHEATVKSAGRHVLNLWQIFRREYTFSSYTFENNVFELLHRRIPRYTNATMSRWMQSNTAADKIRVLVHFQERVATVMDLVNETDIITKNSEFARVFGVEFMTVLTRGSQYKVEAFMFRLAKPESFILPSPSREDVGLQNAAECIPMIMEPASGYYKSPLVVLDFQSLYPSIMIAYNYCYSTCLGRIRPFQEKYRIGFTEVQQPRGIFGELRDHIQVSPNGLVFVKTTIRKSLLAKMLEELLETRVMVKQAMKSSKHDKALLRILDARQLSLKFIANVTYGYTSASFSGRMPCVEIADAIVEAGRQTLENAVKLIQDTPSWGGKVVYGDTDSLFISLPGKTKEEAFRVGQEIADTVTRQNPKPIKLKFEKVYLPCVLQSKKRYVGFKYETPDDSVPVFDAKGIETVRRDGVPAQRKMLEVAIKMLFREPDLSKIKDYCVSEWNKIETGKVTVQDFVFGKEVRLGTYSDKAPPQPQAVAAALVEGEDNRAYLYGDRVPYVIGRRGLQGKLNEVAYPLKDMLWNEGDGNEPVHLGEAYYIEKMLVPPLQRVFEHIGVDIKSWYSSMAKARKADGSIEVSTHQRYSPGHGSDKHTRRVRPKYKIDSHFKKADCVACGRSPEEPGAFCDACKADAPLTLLALSTRLRDAEAKFRSAHVLCASCTKAPAGPSAEIGCESYDCTWFFERHKAGNDLARIEGLWAVMKELDV